MVVVLTHKEMSYLVVGQFGWPAFVLIFVTVAFCNNSNNRTFGSISILKFKIEATYNIAWIILSGCNLIKLGKD